MMETSTHIAINQKMERMRHHPEIWTGSQEFHSLSLITNSNSLDRYDLGIFFAYKDTITI